MGLFALILTDPKAGPIKAHEFVSYIAHLSRRVVSAGGLCALMAAIEEEILNPVIKSQSITVPQILGKLG